jgi:hypothetical protein
MTETEANHPISAQVILGNQLTIWRIGVIINQKGLAKDLVSPMKEKYSSRAIRSWETGEKIPPISTIGQLVVFLYDQKVKEEGPDGQIETRKLWSEPGQVLDWVALVGYSRQDLLALPLDETVKKWLEGATGPIQRWLHPSLPKADVKQVEVEPLVKTLKSMADYRRPEKRLTVLYGPPGSGTSTLAAAVLAHPAIQSYFRSGGQFLTEASIRWLEQAGETPPPDRASQLLRPVSAWWDWLEDDATVGLVVIDNLTDTKLLSRLLSHAGAQLRFLVTTADSQVVTPRNTSLESDQIHYMPVGDLNPDETPPLSPHPTIDRKPVGEQFHKRMQPAPSHRILWLGGPSKMGKSHLLTNVFTLLAEKTYRVPCVVVDLRSKNVMTTAPDILHQSCVQLGGERCFPTYYAAYEKWFAPPPEQIK